MIEIALIPLALTVMLVIPPVRRSIVSGTRSFFGGWLRAWRTQRLVYPPSPNEITTSNRILPSWVTSYPELLTYTRFKEPTLLNFSLPDERSNQFTLSLWNILANRDQYPNGTEQINCVNIMADGSDANEMMLQYGVGKLPQVVLLKKQMPVDRFIPQEGYNPDQLKQWISTIHQ